MFTVHCPRHGTDVLLPERHITALETDGDRITVQWTCWCGHQGSHRTGRSVPRPDPPPELFESQRGSI